MGLIGPEVADAKALGIPLDQAEILVTNKEHVGRTLESYRGDDFAGQLQLTRLERGGCHFRRPEDRVAANGHRVVVGLKSAVNELAEMWGRVARTNTQPTC
jgi:Predicted permease